MGQKFDWVNIERGSSTKCGLWVEGKTTNSSLAYFEQQSSANAATFKGGSGVDIKGVSGQKNALYVYENQTKNPTAWIGNNGSGTALYVRQEGSGRIASFEAQGDGEGVQITGVKGNNNAFEILGQTDASCAYVENNGSGRAFRVKQLGQDPIAWFQGKSDRAKLSVDASDDGESIHLEIYQAEQPIWTPTNNLSDLTLAEDVAPIENALDKVLSLEGVSFSWQDKALGESKEIGVSAEKVGEVLPELVHSADGQSGLVKYEKFVPVLIEAIKAQQKQIEQLQQEVKDLKGQVGSQSSQETSEEEFVPDFYKDSFIFAKTIKENEPAISYGLFIDDNKKIPMFIYSTTDKQNQVLWKEWDSPSGKISLNQWYHLSVVVSNQQAELFINGKSQGSMKLEAEIADNDNGYLLIGKRYPDNSHFAGQITDVRIWNTARTADEIQTNMSRRLQNVNNKELSLVGYWMLNRGSEATACDATFYDQYGIIQGASWVTSTDLPIKSLTPKEKFLYADNSKIALFDPDHVLPAEVQPTTRWLANFHQSFKGLGGTIVNMKLLEQKKDPRAFMPRNFTSLRPDKLSDDFFVERRLNGLNPGRLKRVENKPWQYVINYDFSQIEVDPFAIFPKTIEARFCLDSQQLHLHSIEYTLHGETQVHQQTPVDSEWERAKEIFRCTELVYHESRSHLGRTHMNIDQYAMAYYRNVVNNPITELLDPHFEGVLNINQRGGRDVIGFKDADGNNVDGVIAATSAISLDTLHILLKEEVSNLTYRNWSPREYTIPNYVVNNHFDRAAIAMWNIINEYVGRFFAAHQAGINDYWSEIEGMSEDLSTHSVLKQELGTLDIKTMHDLKQLCVYVIYISSFYHSWVNNKQYDDGGDIEYGSLGLWQPVNPQENLAEFIDQAARRTRQSSTLWTLSSVRYNLIMDVGPAELKDAIWKQRHLIEPGLPLDMLLMSISI